jgi:accessory gene regulator B
MIDKLVDNISTSLVNKFPEELPPYGVTRYGIKFLISNLLPILLLLLIGTVINAFNEVMISILSFSTLRLVSGGFHAKKPELCLVISTIMILSIAKFGYFFEEYTVVVNLLSLTLVLIFSPSNIEGQTKILKENFKYLKLVSLAILAVGFFLDNYLISTSFLAQSIFLIRLKGGGKNE